jgi:hypothetical protein
MLRLDRTKKSFQFLRTESFANHATTEFDAELKLTHLSNGDYTVTDLTDQYDSVPEKIWLCGVTQFVFQSEYPQEIYVKRNVTVS